MQAELRHRLCFGPVLAAIVLAAFLADFLLGRHEGIALIILIGAPFGCHEFAGLVARQGVACDRRVLYLFAPLIAVQPVLEELLRDTVPAWPEAPVLFPLLLAGGLLATAGLQLRRGVEGFLGTFGATTAGLVYLGVLPACLLLLATRTGHAGFPMRGEVLVLLTLVSCKFGDTFAFTGGKLFGRHKLTPTISPGKTWEGFAASILGAIAGTYLATAICVWAGSPLPFAGWWAPAVWGAVIAPVGVLGDLVESMLKRESGIKDSGTTLPGFGGFLDVFDAVLVVAPVAYGLGLVL